MTIKKAKEIIYKAGYRITEETKIRKLLISFNYNKYKTIGLPEEIKKFLDRSCCEEPYDEPIATKIFYTPAINIKDPADTIHIYYSICVDESYSNYEKRFLNIFTDPSIKDPSSYDSCGIDWTGECTIYIFEEKKEKGFLAGEPGTIIGYY
jgi:hypothetical protein